MPSAERMMEEYIAQEYRERGRGNAGLWEAARCIRLARLLSEVVYQDAKPKIAGTL
jgi:hypothetical protein